MKNWKLVLGIAAVALVSAALGAGITAYIQSRTAARLVTPPFATMPMYRSPARVPAFGRMPMMGPGVEMHEWMEEALSEALDISHEELDELFAESESREDLAQQLDLSEEDLEAHFEEAHASAIDKAVEEGYLDQDQAEWMEEHMDGMGGWFFGDAPFARWHDDFGYGHMRPHRHW